MLASPLSVPAVLMLVDQWRYPLAIIRRMVVLLYAFILALCTVVWMVFGPALPAMLALGWGLPAVCWVLFLRFCQFRDGRLVFTIVTGVLLATMLETVANLAAPHASPGYVLFYICLSLAAVPVLYFVCRKPFLRMLKFASSGWLRISLLPAVLLACFWGAFTFPASYAGRRHEPLPVLALCAAVVMIYVALYYLLDALRNEKRTSRGNEVLSAQIRLMEHQTAGFIASERENRMFRHDMRHTLRLLGGAIQAKSWPGVEEVVRSLDGQMDALAEGWPLRSYTGNLMVDTVLSYFAQVAGENGVDFTVKLALDDALMVDMTELAVVFANALENCFAACLKLPAGQPRYVRVAGSHRTRQHFLSFVNSCAGPVAIDKETGLPHAGQEGLGTQSIAAFAKKYDAIVDFSYADGVFTLGMLI